MLSKNDTTCTGQLDAPLALSAVQLEQVAGGMTLAKIGPIGPTNGLYQVVKLGSLAQIGTLSQVAI